MKPIYIDFTGEKQEDGSLVFVNETAISEALHAVNGAAHEHTYTRPYEIRQLASYAESRVLGIVGSKKAAVGAQFHATSGSPMPNSYRYPRRVTTVHLKRRSRGWYLESVSRSEIWGEAGGSALILTQDQDEIVVSHVRKQYSIAKPKDQNDQTT